MLMFIFQYPKHFEDGLAFFWIDLLKKRRQNMGPHLLFPLFQLSKKYQWVEFFNLVHQELYVIFHAESNSKGFIEDPFQTSESWMWVEDISTFSTWMQLFGWFGLIMNIQVMKGETHIISWLMDNMAFQIGIKGKQRREYLQPKMATLS